MLTTPSPKPRSPTRRRSLPFTDQLAALKAQFAFTAVGGGGGGVGRGSTSSVVSFSDDGDSLAEEKRRSVSRGREFHSSGRGGAGNIRRSSQDPLPAPSTDIPSPSRGREREAPRNISSGRGGVGNIRSPSRSSSIARIPEDFSPSDLDHLDTASVLSLQESASSEWEREVIRRAVEARGGAVQSTGRGGAGNIASKSKSPSRSRSRDPHGLSSFTAMTPTNTNTNAAPANDHSPMHSTGRGGAGNFRRASVDGGANAGEVERGRRRDEGIHSTGRGGHANITSLPSPPPEHHQPHPNSSPHTGTTGRGGRGNIRSVSREGERSVSLSREGRGGGSASREGRRRGGGDGEMEGLEATERSPSRDREALEEIWGRVAK